MGALRALLIAVPSDLDFTVEDAARVRDALLASGYAAADVTVLDTPGATRRTGLYTALNTFLGGLRDGDFGLVYFSGHGVRVDDVDHLVPYGYDPAAGPAELVAVRPDELLGGLGAQATLLVCLDACRDAADAGFADVQRPAFTRLRENVALLYGCPPGRQAMGNAAGSFMGRALAEALGPGTPPRTVSEVIAAVRQRTREIAVANGGAAHPEAWWLNGRTGPPAAEHADRAVCSSGPGTGPWAEAVRTSALWGRVVPSAADTGPLADGLGRLIEKVAAIRRDTTRPDRAGPDPWDDPHYPVRVLRQLDRLVPPAADGGRLSALEAVVLLATPFVREAAVACGRRALAGLYPPEGPHGTAEESGDEEERHLADDMADVRRAFGQIEAKRLRLLAAAEAAGEATAEARTAAVAAEQWLRHRLLTGWDQLWDRLADRPRTAGTSDSATPGDRSAPQGVESLVHVLDLLTGIAAPAAGLGPQPLAHSRDRLRWALFQVAAQMRTRPGPEAPNDEPWQTGLAAQLGVHAPYTFWRPARLAELLHMAELLAVDPRSLDGIVVDHLGVPHHRVTAEDLVAQVADSDFRPVDTAHPADWTLLAACRSAALHVALERQADSAASAARNIAKAQPNEALLALLPRHINTDALQPADPGSYEAPPPRFQLAEDGVQPLIMGTELYGDRLLAVRELYQNGLDACRLLFARQQYAARVGDGARQPAELGAFTVAFTLARDPSDGRLYVECRDDGIGMTAEELRDLFARAGRRNEQSPARVRELRRWRRAGVVPELNSRFGIGVFSYFMLAEEIRVTTRPAAKSGFGTGSRGHRVDVVADSGLMHIRPCDDIDAGTTVRLYLRPEFDAEPPSLIGFVNEHVWCSEVTVTVEDRTGDAPVVVRRPAGELTAAASDLLPRQDGQRGVWWMQGKGRHLVDGIAVTGDKGPFGYIVDLRRRHRPVLTASRNDLREFDRATVRRELAETADQLTPPGTVSLSWLWSLVEDDPVLGMAVVDRLLTAEAEVDVGEGREDDSRLESRLRPLGTVGCLPLDREDSQRMLASSSPAGMAFFMRWRAELLGWARRAGDGPEDPHPFPRGFPRPRAVDAVLFRDARPASSGRYSASRTRRVPHLALMTTWNTALSALETARVTGLGLRVVLRALRRYAVVGIPVPAVDDPRAVGQVPCTHEAATLLRYFLLPDDSGMTGELAAANRAAPVAFACHQGMPLGRVVELVNRLRLLDPRLPQLPPPGPLAAHVPTPAEVAVLEGLNGASDVLPEVVTPAVAAYFAHHTGGTAADVRDVALRYRDFGYQVRDGRYEEAAFTRAELNLLFSRGELRDLRDLARPVTPHRLLELAAQNPQAEVATTLARLSELAERVGLRTDLDSTRLAPLLPRRPARWWQYLPSATDRPDVRYSTWEVLWALSRGVPYGQTGEVVGQVDALAAAGLADPEAVGAAWRWLELPADRRPVQFLRGDWYVDGGSNRRQQVSLQLTSGENEIDVLLVLCAAMQHRISLGAAADLLRDEAGPFGIGVVEIPPECRSLHPEYADYRTLAAPNSEGLRSRIPLRVLLDHSQRTDLPLPAAADRLRAYAPLGVDCFPDLPPDPASTWPGADRAVEGLLRHAPLGYGTLTPLGLVVIAVRLDRGLRSTYRALAPYGPYGLDMGNCPEPGDDAHAPDWRDVILLSRHLTGAEPALTGEVGADHIELAAEETELTPAEVRERLAYFAPLFGLVLPDTDAPEPTAAVPAVPAPEVTAHAGP